MIDDKNIDLSFLLVQVQAELLGGEKQRGVEVGVGNAKHEGETGRGRTQSNIDGGLTVWR